MCLQLLIRENAAMNRDHTKIIIAEALIRLVQEKPLDKITISEIISACNTSRRTFYYHFADKQDLVCWIFDWEVATHVGLQDVIMIIECPPACIAC